MESAKEGAGPEPTLLKLKGDGLAVTDLRGRDGAGAAMDGSAGGASRLTPRTCTIPGATRPPAAGVLSEPS